MKRKIFDIPEYQYSVKFRFHIEFSIMLYSNLLCTRAAILNCANRKIKGYYYTTNTHSRYNLLTTHAINNQNICVLFCKYNLVLRAKFNLLFITYIMVIKYGDNNKYIRSCISYLCKILKSDIVQLG